MSPSLASFVAVTASVPGFGSGVVEEMVTAANGWGGVALIFGYSVLVAAVLPLPGEIVLVPAVEGTLRLGLPTWTELALVVLLASVGKALGSLLALSVGHRASRSGPVVGALESLGVDPVSWSKRRTVELVRRYGYVGLVGALTVPVFPDTLSIYAFSVLSLDRAKFVFATFAGSVGRLLVTLFVLKGALAAA